jgi:hypothetical protein
VSNDKTVALLIFLISLSLFVASAGGHLYSVDEVTNYILAESILHFHSLALSPHSRYALTYNVDLFQLPCRRGSTVNGTFYSCFGLAEPFLAVPFIALAEIIGVTPWIFVEATFNPLITALTCAIIYLSARKLEYSARVSAVLPFVYGFASFALPYSKFFNDGPLRALFLLASVYFLLPKRDVVLSGAMLGFAILTRVETLVLVPLILVYVVVKSKRRVLAAVEFLAPVLFACLVFGFYNFVRFGSFVDFGKHSGSALKSASYLIYDSQLSTGIPGLLVSPGVGLLYYFPLALLVPLAAYWFIKRHRDEGLLFSSLFIVPLLVYGSVGSFHGWGYWGPRFLLASVPFLVLLLAEAIRSNSIKLRYTTLALALIGVFVNMLGVLVYFQVGFSQVWSQFGADWIPYALWRPEYSPIYEHLKVVIGLVTNYQTDFGAGKVTRKPFDLLWPSILGPELFLTIVSLWEASLFYWLFRVLGIIRRHMISLRPS